MFTFVSIIHVVMCLILIIIVLLQTGKGSDLASAFGGGGSNTMFGSHGAASFLNRLTTIAAIMFMLTSLALAILSARPDKSVLDDILPMDAPVDPAAPATLPADMAMPEAEGTETAPVPSGETELSETTNETAAAPEGGEALELPGESSPPSPDSVPDTGSGE